MRLEFQTYQARKIINVHKHVDGPWFWGKYSAHPYIGCRSGCDFCYLRGSRYLGRRDPAEFDRTIRVKENAAELLARELPRLEREIIGCGDWQQPAEERFRLSRQMLKVVLEESFPLFIIERSPLLTRELDLLVEINQKSWVGVLFSISSLDSSLKRVFEPRSPGVRRRLQAMEQLAREGILTGVSMMPVFPFVGDSERQIDELVQAARDHGGSCVLGGGLTMDGIQADWTLAAAARFNPELARRWRELYNIGSGKKPSYGPPKSYNAHLGLMLREACERHGLLDRLPRYIQEGPLATNKRIAEKLFLKTYDLELEEAGDYRIWAYRKAAWTVDELPEAIDGLYDEKGKPGLAALPSVGDKIAGQIAGWLDNEKASQE